MDQQQISSIVASSGDLSSPAKRKLSDLSSQTSADSISDQVIMRNRNKAGIGLRKPCAGHGQSSAFGGLAFGLRNKLLRRLGLTGTNRKCATNAATINGSAFRHQNPMDTNGMSVGHHHSVALAAAAAAASTNGKRALAVGKKPRRLNGPILLRHLMHQHPAARRLHESDKRNWGQHTRLLQQSMSLDDDDVDYENIGDSGEDDEQTFGADDEDLYHCFEDDDNNDCALFWHCSNDMSDQQQQEPMLEEELVELPVADDVEIDVIESAAADGVDLKSDFDGEDDLRDQMRLLRKLAAYSRSQLVLMSNVR